MLASLVCTPTLVDSELTNPQIVSQTMTECILIIYYFVARYL